MQIDVQLSNGEAAEAAAVQLLDRERKNLEDFCLYEKRSSCFFQLNEKTAYEVRVRYFGYRDTSVQVTTLVQDTLKYHFILEPIAYELPGVSVVDKLIGLKRAGDTLKYNLHAYTLGTEQTLGEILQRLPGIEVDENGDVLFMDEKVDALLLDGKDLVRAAHQLAVDGVQAEVVEGVEVIERFSRGADQLAGAEGDGQTAVNIRLKPEAKGAWRGNVKAMAGHPQRLLVSGTLFRVTSKDGMAVFLRQNNTAEALTPDTSPFGRRLTSRERKVKNIGFELYPQEMAIAGHGITTDGLLRNDDYLLSINKDGSLGTRVDQQLHLTAVAGSRLNQREERRVYFNGGVEEERSAAIRSSYWRGGLENAWAFKVREGQVFEASIQGAVEAELYRQSDRGAFAGEPFEQSQKIRTGDWHLSPELRYVSRAKHGVVFESSQALGIRSHTSATGFNSGSLLPALDSSFTFHQTAVLAQQWSESMLSLRWEKGSHSLKWAGGARWQKGQFKASARAAEPLGSPLSDGQTLLARSFMHALRSEHEWRKTDLRVKLGQVYFGQGKAAGGGEEPAHTFLPAILFRWKYKGAHRVGGSFERKLFWFGSSQLFKPHLAAEPQVRFSSALQNGHVQLQNQWALTFSRDFSASGLKYIVNFGFSQLDGAIAVASIPTNGIILNEWRQTQRTHQYSLQAFTIWQSDKSRLIANTFIAKDNGWAIFGAQEAPLARTLVRSGGSWTWTKWQKWELISRFDFQLVRQSILGQELSFKTFESSLKTVYRYNSWSASTAFAHRWQGAGGNRTSWLAWDVDLSFRMNANWKLAVQGRNLLNLANRERMEATYMPNGSIERAYPVFPGYAVVGFTWYF
ncbi:hypothetical protein [Phaeodactylibacter luteus]|uniref:TonB-dependent receptor n=1 Tax=Phaeodactylibacter luteus TaxID=1564516 RepID=A0A5C6RL00_9BACT|nr:hypothetical protein [Phaeodactylibacter luteus]TXB62923.1 hypothetical protein FRY97_11305 [Phaeodactylibacter luteus]